MNPTRKAILLAALHLALVAGLGGKFLLDRATRPRVWLKTAPVDPDLPIRGRYVRLRVEVPVEGAQLPPPLTEEERKEEPWRLQADYDLQVALVATPEGLVARALTSPSRARGYTPETWPSRVNAQLPETLRGTDPTQWRVSLEAPLACFIPEGVPDPSLRPEGEELWVEATLPRKGPLRPIRLAVKRGGKLEPLTH